MFSAVDHLDLIETFLYQVLDARRWSDPPVPARPSGEAGKTTVDTDHVFTVGPDNCPTE